jgi:tRNA threonylcarbamoyladenosine biosynthesis protein TsaE
MEKTKELILTSPEDATTVASEILRHTEGRKVFSFNGQMGAGKTTLIKGFCKALGVADKTSSPTFSVINEYLTKKGEKLYHFDCYRLKSPLEALDLGCEEYFYSGNYCFIEWPELIGDLIPSDAVQINIDINGQESNGQERVIRIR